MEDGSAPPSAREGRPTPQWSRLAAGHGDDLGDGSDDLGNTAAAAAATETDASEHHCH
jgi:hypothetical protein